MELPSSPSASVPASAGERWPPLESTPEVFNQFMWSLGVPEDDMEFHDVYGLDDDALDMVPQPVLAVVLCFPDPPQDASYPSEQLLFSGEKETQDQVYFIKQIKSLGNACGTIALLHAVGNASSEVNLVENSCLDLFFKSTASMDPNERAVFLEKDDAMARAHSLAANAGVTEELNRVVGTLYELDGMKDGPIKHRSCSSISLLQVLQVYEMVPFFPLFCTSFSISLNWLLKLLTVKFKGNG
ncbi:ubiquitin carboxyl-terminal hydrolase 3 isoform X8 [Sorghum bicolor]|uniref:ubiquitin carboxyl-terminal hydrolase 3 isoform X8 n=1 Tax=Sorghum bicolor TaxID=4558 RepID=UPI000B42528D|nr:ubiquitin carboxyl-terminal hydrolase 3 isoform X8 [Sorghum bicolor]|eukprot:XP_021319401.1 ubiquitin carboxyl-terminal hydrolase 3 isoform X8 [Sorghum bicolor]